MIIVQKLLIGPHAMVSHGPLNWKGNIFYSLSIICYNIHPTTTKRHGASCHVPSSVKQIAPHLNYTRLLVCKLERGGHICGPLSNNGPFCSIFCSSHTLGRDAQSKIPFPVTISIYDNIILPWFSIGNNLCSISKHACTIQKFEHMKYEYWVRPRTSGDVIQHILF